AESRVRKLAAEMPVRFVAFDVLLWKGDEVWKLPLEKRRKRLERLKLPFAISPVSSSAEEARAWLDRLETAGLDGIVCKRLDLPYLPASREGAVKVKPQKTADCVVMGVRWKEKPTRLATLLLGLYDDQGELRYVGTCAVAPARHELLLDAIR